MCVCVCFSDNEEIGAGEEGVGGLNSSCCDLPGDIGAKAGDCWA